MPVCKPVFVFQSCLCIAMSGHKTTQLVNATDRTWQACLLSACAGLGWDQQQGDKGRPAHVSVGRNKQRHTPDMIPWSQAHSTSTFYQFVSWSGISSKQDLIKQDNCDNIAALWCSTSFQVTKWNYYVIASIEYIDIVLNYQQCQSFKTLKAYKISL